MKLTMRIEDHVSLGNVDIQDMDLNPRFAAVLFRGIADEIERELT